MNPTIEPSAGRAAPTAAPGPTGAAQYLTFLLGGEMFAIGILAIKEILEYREPTPVPMMPASVCGVINLRGAVVPVLDLQARFGKPPREVGRRTCLVILETAAGEERETTQTVGVVVDAVSEVIEIAASDIEPPPAFGARIRSDFIQGIGKVKGRFVILLDVDRALSSDEIGAIEHAADAADAALASVA